MSDLEEATKKYIGYTEQLKICSNCDYSEERENVHLDRDFYRVCTFSNLVILKVKDNSSCEKGYKSKTK